MLRELIFHIGLPKTGSSALQVFFARNLEHLLQKSVDYLPIGEIQLAIAGKISSGNGAYLARCLLPDKDPAKLFDSEQYIREFFDAVRGSAAEIGIVSSELFVDADPHALSALVVGLRDAGVRARCFYFIRDQVQFLSAYYIQKVKRHGCTQLPADYIKDNYSNMKFLNYYSLYCRQHDIFGIGNVVCRVYENASSGDNGLAADMLRSLSIDHYGMNLSVEVINNSMSIREISIMLLLNKIKPRMRFSDIVVENAAQLAPIVLRHTHNLLPHALVNQIKQYFADENDRISRELSLSPVLFPPFETPQQPEEVSFDNFSSLDLITFFGGLLVRFDERLAALEGQLIVV